VQCARAKPIRSEGSEVPRSGAEAGSDLTSGKSGGCRSDWNEEAKPRGERSKVYPAERGEAD
jgi:hypothetical protein